MPKNLLNTIPFTMCYTKDHPLLLFFFEMNDCDMQTLVCICVLQSNTQNNHE